MLRGISVRWRDPPEEPLPNSTADHGLTVLYRITTDGMVQCVVLDIDGDVPVDGDGFSPSLSQVSRDYLVRRCMERIFRGRYEVATGSEDDFWFNLTFNNISDCVNSHLVRIILTGVALWGIYKQNPIIMLSFLILIFNNKDRNVTFCMFLYCILFCVCFYGLDLIIVQNVAVWAVYNLHLIVLNALAVLMIYNLNPRTAGELNVFGVYNRKLMIGQILFVWMFSTVWENRYYVYCLALFAIYTESELFMQSIALCGVYNQERIILTGIAVLAIFYRHKKRRCPFTYTPEYVEFSGYSLPFQIRSIRHIFSCIKKKIKKARAAKPPFEKATREDLNDVQMDEDQGGEDSDQIQRRLAASMDIPLTLAGDYEGQNRLIPAGRRFAASMDIPLTLAGDYEGQIRLIPAGRRFAASMDIPLTLAGDYEGQIRLTPAGRRFAASMDIPLTLAGDDGDDGQNRLAAGLTPDRRRFAASMDIPLTLANVCGDGDEGQNRLTAGLSPAERRLAASMDIPLTLAEKTESFDQ